MRGSLTELIEKLRRASNLILFLRKNYVFFLSVIFFVLLFATGIRSNTTAKVKNKEKINFFDVSYLVDKTSLEACFDGYKLPLDCSNSPGGL